MDSVAKAFFWLFCGACALAIVLLLRYDDRRAHRAERIDKVLASDPAFHDVQHIRRMGFDDFVMGTVDSNATWLRLGQKLDDIGASCDMASVHMKGD